MKIRAFINDKAYVLISAIFINIIITLFLLAVQTNQAIIVMVTILFYIFTFLIIIVEFGRRKKYYDELMDIVEALDKKYLLTEVLKEPEFLDGKLFFDIMRSIDKSMNDHVNEYKNKEVDYKNYIEMWVHEIKTPLAACKLIVSNNENSTTKSIMEELEKVEGFVEQALFYARSATLEKDYIIKGLNLGDSIRKVIRRNSKAFIYKNIKIELHDIDVQVYSDSKWLDFILNQIVSNALKYTPEQVGILEIYTKSKEQMIELYIKDNGIGIKEEDLSRIFDRGFTGNTGRNDEKATGMGLFLCKTLCQKLYLNISAQSNKGTTIIINFPLRDNMLLK